GWRAQGACARRRRRGGPWRKGRWRPALAPEFAPVGAIIGDWAESRETFSGPPNDSGSWATDRARVEGPTLMRYLCAMAALAATSCSSGAPAWMSGAADSAAPDGTIPDDAAPDVPVTCGPPGLRPTERDAH